MVVMGFMVSLMSNIQPIQIEVSFLFFCVVVLCPSRVAPENGQHVLPSQLTYGNQVVYQCNKGLYLNGSNISTCTGEGSWSSPIPTCAVKAVGTGKPSVCLSCCTISLLAVKPRQPVRRAYFA